MSHLYPQGPKKTRSIGIILWQSQVGKRLVAKGTWLEMAIKNSGSQYHGFEKLTRAVFALATFRSLIAV
jgi:hypothetical protein